MRTLVSLAMVVALFASVSPVLAGQAEDEVAIRQASKQAMESRNKHDFEAHAALYTHPFETFEDSLDRTTHEKNHKESWEREKDVRVKLLDEIGVVLLTPDIAIHKYRTETTGRLDAAGKPLPPVRTLSARVYAKKNGKWLTTAVFSRPIEE